MNKLLIIPVLFIALLVGCSSDASLEPVSINQDVDSCATCNMGINDEEHAAQVLFENSTSNIYDDIGCMLISLQEESDNVGAGYVKDFNSKEWIDMNDATYVQESDISTPMSYGIVAFDTSDDAETFQQDNGGDVYSFDDLLQLDVQDLKHDAGHGHHDEGSDSHE